MRIEEIRKGLAARMEARRGEVEQATLTRVKAIAAPAESVDPEYTDGLRQAVSVAVGYGIEAVSRREASPPPIPTALLTQARLAARHGIRLEAVLRRYLAGYTLLGDFLIEESERDGRLNAASLKRLLRVLGALLDRLIAAVSEEYEREAGARTSSTEERLAREVECLLEGQRLDTSQIAYDFDACHQAAIAKGPGSRGALRAIAKKLDRRLLLVRREEEIAWAWLGGRRAIGQAELGQAIALFLPKDTSLVLGEPGEGLTGWCFSHRQARAALPVAQRSGQPFVRYAEVALLSTMLQDDLLSASLRRIYLEPLGRGRDGGRMLRETLKAYFAAGRNASSAAATLGVSRQAVTSRLRTIEEALDRSIDSCATEIEMALRSEEHETVAP